MSSQMTMSDVDASLKINTVYTYTMLIVFIHFVFFYFSIIFASLKFSINNENRSMSYQMTTQITTRMATQDDNPDDNPNDNPAKRQPK
jgi:hypothetical protein